MFSTAGAVCNRCGKGDRESARDGRRRNLLEMNACWKKLEVHWHVINQRGIWFWSLACPSRPRTLEDSQQSTRGVLECTRSEDFDLCWSTNHPFVFVEFLMFDGGDDKDEEDDDNDSHRATTEVEKNK